MIKKLREKPGGLCSLMDISFRAVVLFQCLAVVLFLAIHLIAYFIRPIISLTTTQQRRQQRQHSKLLALCQWRIQLWADRAPPPIDQNLGLVMVARLRHGGGFSLNSLTFDHFLYNKCTKSFQLLTPTRGSVPGPRLV